MDVRRKVIELADLCRQHGIWLALDTWQSFDIIGHSLPKGGMIEPEQEEKVCRDWSEAWVKALRLMREDGVLERTAWRGVRGRTIADVLCVAVRAERENFSSEILGFS